MHTDVLDSPGTIRQGHGRTISELLQVAFIRFDHSPTTIIAAHPGPSAERLVMWLDETAVPDEAWDAWFVEVCDVPLEAVQQARLLSEAHVRFAPGATIAEIVHSVITRDGLTETTLAQRVGVAQSQISRWRNGRSVPNRSFTVALAESCRVPVVVIEAAREASEVAVTKAQRVPRPDDVIRDLRRELAAAKAEIIRLKDQLSDNPELLTVGESKDPYR